MQAIQHANGATKKMKKTFSYESEKFFFLLKIKFLKLVTKFVSHQPLSF